MKKIITRIVVAGLFTIPSLAQTTDNTIRTDSTSRSTTDNKSETTVKSPPPTAVAPAVTTINNDVCAVAASGAVQTQILGISMGGTMRDMNCERIKLSKNLYDMGMKVAAVATLCQDERIFTAMLAAGTPCPIDGKIGERAKEEWQARGVLDNAKKEDVGHYAAKPVAVVASKPAEAAAKESSKSGNVGNCAAYTGDDSIVRDRVCGK
jgi:hypothetical protein